MSDPSAVATLQGAEAVLGALTDMASLAWFEVDGDQHIVRWSAGAEALTGYSASELLGMPCVVGVRCQACLNECGVFKRGSVRNVSLVLHRKDGVAVPISKSGISLRDEGGQVTSAIEFMVAQREVPHTAPGGGQLDPLLRSLGRFWVLADMDLRVVDFSPDLASRLGLRREDLLGSTLAKLFGGELFGRESAFLRAVAGGQCREGWHASLRTVLDQDVAVSVSAGKVVLGGDARIFVMIRPDSVDGEDHGEGEGEIPQFEGMVGRSAPMRRIFHLIELLADNDATVLITGDSGTGKELVAHALHARSHRAGGPFVAVNCGALPPELLESELFGHVRGAFTGAVRDRPGRFELADGGTIFLDEVGDMPAHLQVKLLRVLQERAFERVGDARTRSVDVRVIAATNVDLARAVAERRFRDDLYYRLRVVPIEIPSLAERRDDLALLIRYLLGRIGQRRGRALRLSPSAMRALLAYSWPGNVRELENALEYATAVCEGQTVHLGDLPQELHPETEAVLQPIAPPLAASADPPLGSADPPSGNTLAWAGLKPVERAEAEQIRRALAACRYRRTEAADRLGMSRTTLWRKMKLYRLG